MKHLFESILDIDKVSSDSDVYVDQNYRLPEELKKISNCDWVVEKGALKATNYNRGGISATTDIFELVKKYNIKKIIFPTKTAIIVWGGSAEKIKISDIEIECATTINITCTSLDIRNSKISAVMSVDIGCKSLSMVNCDVNTNLLRLSRLSMGKFSFSRSKMNVYRLYVYTNDNNWLEELKKLGVKKTYTIEWMPSRGEYSNVDPLGVLGFNPKQWDTLERFAIVAQRKELWGIKRDLAFQFCWARKNAYFSERWSKKYHMNEYFKNWEQYILLMGSFLM